LEINPWSKIATVIVPNYKKYLQELKRIPFNTWGVGSYDGEHSSYWYWYSSPLDLRFLNKI
jgi:hypothetical protein